MPLTPGCPAVLNRNATRAEAQLVVGSQQRPQASPSSEGQPLCYRLGLPRGGGAPLAQRNSAWTQNCDERITCMFQEFPMPCVLLQK